MSSHATLALLTQECHLTSPCYIPWAESVSSDDEPEQNFVQLLQDNILDSAVGVCFSFFTPGALWSSRAATRLKRLEKHSEAICLQRNKLKPELEL